MSSFESLSSSKLMKSRFFLKKYLHTKQIVISQFGFLEALNNRVHRVDPLRYFLLYLFCGTNAHRKFCYIFMPAGFGMPSKKMDEQKPECSMVFP